MKQTDTKTEIEKLYQEYYPRIYGYIYNKIFSKEDAEDLTHQVFIKICNKWDTFNSQKASVSTWIYTIARNAVIDFYRTHHRHTDLEEIDEPVQDELDILENIISEEVQEMLLQALMKLSQEERDLIILHYYEERSLCSIASDMNIPYGRIKRMHTRALMKLKAEIK
ncbi:MAG: sigma-70 family RNA polymerase sigma factor [Clostridia bacterium]|nr:sigma-70 family RNA polymerase sigma factor [Clostridia bacterium]MDY5555108.1 sigma-70 family RNA polymerase sigma factor [Blautia sp.]